MIVLNDDDLCRRLNEHADTLAELPEFLEQVKERIELLRGEAKSAESLQEDVVDEASVAEDYHREEIRSILSDVSHDQAILIDWALDAGADPATASGFKSSMLVGAIEARAKERSAF